jgi:hypothetical protein
VPPCLSKLPTVQQVTSSQKDAADQDQPHPCL